MRRPSHFMLLFLLLVGTPLFLWAEGPKVVEPEGTEKGSAPQAQLVDRGKSDVLIPSKTPAAGALQGETTTQARKRAATTTRGPWTLFGTVLREFVSETAQNLKNGGAGIGLELIPLGEGRHASNALRSTVCAANGDYSWAGLFPGEYRLRALPDRESSSHLPVAIDLRLPTLASLQEDAASHRFRKDILLPMPRTLTGQLVTKETNYRSGLMVSVSETGLHRGTAVSNDKGGFEINGVGTGPFEILVRTDAGKTVPVTGIKTESQAKDRVAVAVVLP